MNCFALSFLASWPSLNRISVAVVALKPLEDLKPNPIAVVVFAALRRTGIVAKRFLQRHTFSGSLDLDFHRILSLSGPISLTVSILTLAVMKF